MGDPVPNNASTGAEFNVTRLIGLGPIAASHGVPQGLMLCIVPITYFTASSTAHYDLSDDSASFVVVSFSIIFISAFYPQSPCDLVVLVALCFPLGSQLGALSPSLDSLGQNGLIDHR